jgi:hypothetical protein
MAGTIHRDQNSPTRCLQIGWNKWRHATKHMEHGPTTTFLHIINYVPGPSVFDVANIKKEEDKYLTLFVFFFCYSIFSRSYMLGGSHGSKFFWLVYTLCSNNSCYSNKVLGAIKVINSGGSGRNCTRNSGSGPLPLPLWGSALNFASCNFAAAILNSGPILRPQLHVAGRNSMEANIPN